MSDTEDKPKSLEEQLRELMQQANLSFLMPQGGGPAAAAGGTRAPADEGPTEPPPDPLARMRAFDMKPRDVRDYLDRYVIRQDEAKKVLSVAICDHYNHVRACIETPDLQLAEYAKHNVILLGPTGVGKTYLIKCAARLIGVPFVKADATKFSETGYVGHDVEDLVRDLVKAADGDRELAQFGIIFLDEVDKIAAAPSTGKDVSGRGVQTNLLKLMEDTDVSPFSQTDIIGQMQAVMDLQRGKAGEPSRQMLNTRNILFIVSGAFDRLPEIVRKRVRSSAIGFSAVESGTPDGAFFRQVNTRDFVEYGFEPEFIGRLPVRVVCDPLTADDLADIMLHAEGSILQQYRRDFAGYGIDLNLPPEAVRRIAELAHTEGTGARGLMTVMERLFRDFKFELPSAGISALTLDRAAVDDPRTALDAQLKHSVSEHMEQLRHDIDAWSAGFARQHGFKLSFDRHAVAALAEASLAGGKTVRSLCEERFHDLEYGLRLIARNTGRTTFRLTRRFVEDPDTELAARIAQSFAAGAGDADAPDAEG